MGKPLPTGIGQLLAATWTNKTLDSSGEPESIEGFKALSCLQVEVPNYLRTVARDRRTLGWLALRIELPRASSEFIRDFSGKVLQHFLACCNGFCDQLLLEIVTQKSSKMLRKSLPEDPRSLQNGSGRPPGQLGTLPSSACVVVSQKCHAPNSF